MENKEEIIEIKRLIKEGFDEIFEEVVKIKKYQILFAKDILTSKEACLYTGLCKSYLYKLTCYGEIPHYKSAGGKYLYFDKEELNKWMKQRRGAEKLSAENSADKK